MRLTHVSPKQEGGGELKETVTGDTISFDLVSFATPDGAVLHRILQMTEAEKKQHPGKVKMIDLGTGLVTLKDGDRRIIKYKPLEVKGEQKKTELLGKVSHGSVVEIESHPEGPFIVMKPQGGGTTDVAVWTVDGKTATSFDHDRPVSILTDYRLEFPCCL